MQEIPDQTSSEKPKRETRQPDKIRPAQTIHEARQGEKDKTRADKPDSRPDKKSDERPDEKRPDKS